MKLLRYTYSIIRYVHDPLSGESLNVGVVVFCREAGFLKASLLTRRTKRLSDAFRDFDVEAHNYVMRDLDRGLFFLHGRGYGSQGILFGSIEETIEPILRQLWPDRGTRYVFGDASAGVTENPAATLEELYDRFVTEQMPVAVEDDAKKDERVWKRVEDTLRPRIQLSQLVPKTVPTETGPVVVTRTHQDRKLNIFQTLSFDLFDERSITQKAQLWYGRAASFHRTPTIGEVLYLLARPKSPSKEPWYERAYAFLRHAEGAKVFTLDDLEPFAKSLEQIVGRREPSVESGGYVQLARTRRLQVVREGGLLEPDSPALPPKHDA